MKGIHFLLLPILTVFGDTFSNNNLVIEKPINVATGSNASFYCQIPSGNPDVIDSCQIVTPLNEIWTVENGIVTDNSSNPVSGYTGIDLGDAGKTCGIDIAVTSLNDIGIEF